VARWYVHRAGVAMAFLTFNYRWDILSNKLAKPITSIH